MLLKNSVEGFKDASDWAVKFWHYQMWLMIELAYWRQLTPLTSGAELLLDSHIEKFKLLCKLATNLAWSFQAVNVKRTVKADFPLILLYKANKFSPSSKSLLGSISGFILLFCLIFFFF